MEVKKRKRKIFSNPRSICKSGPPASWLQPPQPGAGSVWSSRGEDKGELINPFSTEAFTGVLGKGSIATFCPSIYSSVLGLDLKSLNVVGIVCFGTELVGNLGSPGLSVKRQLSVCGEPVDSQVEGSTLAGSSLFMRSGCVRGQWIDLWKFALRFSAALKKKTTQKTNLLCKSTGQFPWVQVWCGFSW